MSAPVVRVIGWSPRSAVADVDGIRVRVRWQGRRPMWLCDEHGRDHAPHCPCTEALAATPVPSRRKDES